MLKMWRKKLRSTQITVFPLIHKGTLSYLMLGRCVCVFKLIVNKNREEEYIENEENKIYKSI